MEIDGLNDNGDVQKHNTRDIQSKKINSIFARDRFARAFFV